MRPPTGRHLPPPRSVSNHRSTTTTSRRDSDASTTSSRPSTSHSDRSSQLHAINSFLSSSSFPVHLKSKPLPSNKHITETFKFILARLDFTINNNNNKLEDEIFMVLKALNCPLKITKSALKAPATPHSFPSVLGVLHWLVQLATFTDHVENNDNRLVFGDSMSSHLLNTYLLFIRGDDDAMEAQEQNFIAKLQQKKKSVEENVKLLEEKEEEKSILQKDIEKFNEMVEQLQGHDVYLDKQIQEKKEELGRKMEEMNRICVENKELRKKVEEQGINMWDAERMKRELQLVETDIGEAESERNKWEEKYWDVNAAIGTKLKENEALQIECNQAIRRLKLGNDIHYELNAKGSTPAEVLGIDYKSTLKPALASNSDEIKKTSLENLETHIHLQQVSREIEAKINAKRNCVAVLESRIDEMENRINLIKNETQDYISRCAMEARQLVENKEAESHAVDVLEKEARELLESAKARLQETMVRCDEEVQMCARELFKLIDLVSKYKEFTDSKISEMKNDVSATAAAIAQVHKDSLRSSIKNYPNN